MSWTSPQCPVKVGDARCGLEEDHSGDHQPWKGHLHEWGYEDTTTDGVVDYRCRCGATKSVYQHTDSEGTNLTIRIWCPSREDRPEDKSI